MSEYDSMRDRCAAMRPAMLVAEPEELRGMGATGLAVHLRSCMHCRAEAQSILQATATLAERVAADARVTPVRTAPRNHALSPAWMALPVAAALAGLLITRRLDQQEPSPRVGLLSDVKRPVVNAVVNAAPGRDVAVFRTQANITVVWDLGLRGDP